MNTPVIQALFSDRGWVLKLAGAALLFAGLCHLHLSAMNRVHASDAAVDHPAPADLGKQLRLWGSSVSAVDPFGFRVETESGPLSIRTGHPPALRPGDIVGFSARLTGPRLLHAEEYGVIHGYAWKRPLNYAVSIAVVLLVLARVRGRFRGRPSSGLFQGRT